MAFGLSDPTQQIESSVDNLSAAVSAKLGAAIQSAKTTTSVPWTNQKKSRFFPYITIEPGFWDQLFPYRLIVVDVTRGGQIVNGTPQVSAPKVTRDGSALLWTLFLSVASGFSNCQLPRHSLVSLTNSQLTPQRPFAASWKNITASNSK